MKEIVRLKDGFFYRIKQKLLEIFFSNFKRFIDNSNELMFNQKINYFFLKEALRKSYVKL